MSWLPVAGTLKRLCRPRRPAHPHSRLRGLLPLAGLFGLLGLQQVPPAPATRPADFRLFGNTVAVLPNGNIVVADPNYDRDTTRDVGAVYLVDGRTKALISQLTGSTTNDQVGSGGITVLANGNYVVCSPNWSNGPATQAGAVTWASGTAGVSGVVSAANSLVGSTPNDQVGNHTPPRAYGKFTDEAVVIFNPEVAALPNGNYVVSSPFWNNGPAARAGAVTWGNGRTGTSGVVSAANSLVGANPDDQVGNNAPDAFAEHYSDNTSVQVLPGGNYLVSSPRWQNRAAPGAGAVTWASGTTGLRGVVGAANSLVGTHPDDQVGCYECVTVLPAGNYVVCSPHWKNRASAYNVGAVTWGAGQTGIKGPVSAANSLVGSHSNDAVGNGGVTLLPGGNFLIRSMSWQNRAAPNAGAVTWASGTAGLRGVVSAANSLVGTHPDDWVGSGNVYLYTYDLEDYVYQGVTVLPTGHYVVSSPSWQNRAGAVTWGNGRTGLRGAVSAANSLVGTHRDDLVGATVTVLTNGNYVVGSPDWRHQSVAQAGAVTWGNGRTGTRGAVSPQNSLVGTHRADLVGLGVQALTNGNYVVSSPRWQNKTVARAGAVTWGNGRSGTTGMVSSRNSLVGTHPDDQVGNNSRVDSYINDWTVRSNVTALPNGHYVVSSPYWRHGTAHMAGAVTWGNGRTGTRGAVSEANSLVGANNGDLVGSAGVTPLATSNYVVLSPYWRNGAAAGAGAVTFGRGSTGVRGRVDAANSLVGAREDDFVGDGGVTPLPSGNFVVGSRHWQRRAATPVGAVTWGSGTAGLHGVVGAANSLIGTHAYDFVGEESVVVLTNGNYVVRSPNWQNGSVARAGAVTWGSGTVGVRGVIGAANSLVGSSPDEQVGAGEITALPNGHYLVSSPEWWTGSAPSAVTWGSGTAGVRGRVSVANSLVSAGSREERLEVAVLTSGDYLVRTYVGRNDTVFGKLVITLGNGATGTTGPVGTANSLVPAPSPSQPR